MVFGQLLRKFKNPKNSILIRIRSISRLLQNYAENSCHEALLLSKAYTHTFMYNNNNKEYPVF